MIEYQEFLEQKTRADVPTGLSSIPELNSALFPFQRDIVAWALKRGRAAIFADCGMGKTLMQLEWARHIPGPVLILAPLAVAGQTVEEGEKFGIAVNHARKQSDVIEGINITNYEMLNHFETSMFTGCVLDESSILKSYMGKTKRDLLNRFDRTPYKLACTATPAPNDHMELGNHAEFLNVMTSSEMLSRWFINNAMEAGNYRLKGHAERDFWRWVATWAVALSKPSDMGEYSDDGYILPPLKFKHVTIESKPPEGEMFHVSGSLSATELHKEKRRSADERAAVVADFVREADGQVLIWCDANYEADAIKRLIPHAVDVRGSDSTERKTAALLDFAHSRPGSEVLITKPSVAGFGMNFQQCHNVAFIGLSYSFEALYQALRRTYRFGQKHPVTALIVETENESGIRITVERKMSDHEALLKGMSSGIRDARDGVNYQLTAMPEPELAENTSFKLWHGDCVQVAEKHIEDGTVDFSVFSPPFSNLYIYSDSVADMGNSANDEEFFGQMAFLIRELKRITVNGRLCAVHCKDLPSYKGRDGAAGLIDFPGKLIKAFEDGGWQYHSRVTIWKDPVIEMQRTKNHGLLHKQLCKDSSASRQGMADFLLTFRKWDGDEFPKPVCGPSPEVRFDGQYMGTEGPKNARTERDYSIQVWQRYASPVWFDIDQTDVLQGYKYASSEADERHICPLQLGVIRRAIDLWTNPGDLVFSPFTGIGSEGYVAIEMGRRFVGVELKRSYWEQARSNLSAAKAASGDLFNVA